VSKKVWLNGKLLPAEEASVSVFDHGLLYGDGVFEGIRVYGGRIFKCATHLRRLFASARAIRMNIGYSIDELTDAMRQTVAANGNEAGYIRLCVTRGVGTLGLNPLLCNNASVFVIADAITLYPKEMYDNGMAVITSSVCRNHPAALSPRIKSLNYLNNILAKLEALDAGVMEAVMLNHQGNVAECTGDNIFIVRAWQGAQTLMTPPLHAGILEGVTMNLVIELAKQRGIPFARMDLTKHDLYIADEMFLTGTAAEVIPVNKVDGRSIGEGEPGPITRQLIQAFHELVSTNAPED
jgi:branched-chain amino acid aminotransferase